MSVKDSEVDTLVHDRTNKNSPRLKNEVISIGAVAIQQVHPKTNFICVHGYAMPEACDMSQGNTREDMNYLCVSLIFAYGVISDMYSRCYIHTSKVTA